MEEIEKAKQEERDRIIAIIESKYTDEDLSDAEPVALTLFALVEEIRLF